MRSDARVVVSEDRAHAVYEDSEVRATAVLSNVKGRLRVVEVRVCSSDGVRGGSLREIPLYFIESQANGLVLEGEWGVVDAKLNVPLRRSYGDAFYRSVARVYTQMVALGRYPSGEMAKANDVPATT